MSMQFTYFMPTKVIFGAGVLNELGGTPLPGLRPLVVASAGGSLRRNGVMDRLLYILRARDIEPVLYEKITPNPTLDVINAGAATAQTHGCDFVLGIGGGSSIDAAKAIALTASNGGSFWDYVTDGSGGHKTPTKAALPIVSIPTTSGTGTEADPWTVVSRPDTQEKIGWGNDSTFPILSIVDPELMLTVPPRITALTGMDALFHCFETYLSLDTQPVVEGLALEATRLIRTNLPRAVRNGRDAEARSNLAWASTAAGFCESYSRCIGMHAMEHTLTGIKSELTHGAGLVLLSVPFLTAMGTVAPAKCTRLAAAMGADVTSEISSRRPGMLIRQLQMLIHETDLNDLRLTDFGFSEDMVPALAEKTLATMPKHFANTPGKADRIWVENIFRQAFKKNW